MKKIEIDGFELNEDHLKMLLDELKKDGVKTIEDLQKYLKNHWYKEDQVTKCHLLIDRYSKKRNFAIPFDE